ncbi:sigma-70 family RNA polymerase sigma factor [Frigoriglobus tundricola]|uniref:RNA polymerase sigma-70 region 2 domain-containing protein n=1 Tax=Frigoriglobus tundricola TaxID=2774151 RepID=A0A6M5YUH9_9BACT|nr:sigma-70 family RNA polymerase sigma factor [Frigoriglobus tundricola]QJW97074.1 hypothetical protein FTUN_4639 [Frigoriglobus tundricola]
MAALLSLFRHATGSVPPATDGELLTRFADRRDEEAFAELVRRHGPVVYRVCCRLVGADAAEDAFQAVFLVLATRWAAARAAGSVGGWLVGVAGRVARQMRRSARRRTRHETAAAESRATECAEAPGGLTDQFRVLDEELTRLPDSLRDPVVLCLLQGRTQEQAAVELGRDARTLRRRLERAKQVLRARLERRGVVPAVAAAVVTGVGSVSAAVPHDLARRTVAAVFDFLTGGTAVAGSAPVVLAKGVATIMIARKLMHLTAAVIVGLVGLGVGLAGDGPPAPPVPASAGPVPVTQPEPMTPPVVPAVVVVDREIDWQKDEARLQAILKGAHLNTPSPTTTVLIDAMCVHVPRGFCRRSGLTEEESSNTWFLSQREVRMFSALLRAEPGKEVVCRPQLHVAEGQTGSVHVGQSVPVGTGKVVSLKGKKESEKSPITSNAVVEFETAQMIDIGAKVRVTPKIGASGQLLLRIEAENVEIGAPVQLYPADKHAEAVPSFNCHTFQTTVVVPDAGTVVIRSESVAHEVLWVLTPHVIRGEKKASAPELPAPKPVPVVPPAPKPVSAVPAFVDHGTAEHNVEIKDYRVSAGSGVRIAVPALGPVPLAPDLSAPVLKSPEDRK